MPVPFASQFDARTGYQAQRLLIGASLAPGPRTVCACLQVLGRQAEPDFALYHQVLKPSARVHLGGQPSQRLLELLL